MFYKSIVRNIAKNTGVQLVIRVVKIKVERKEK